MTIIEADGVETEPLTVDALDIFAGVQSFIVRCNKIANIYSTQSSTLFGSRKYTGKFLRINIWD